MGGCSKLSLDFMLFTNLFIIIILLFGFSEPFRAEGS